MNRLLSFLVRILMGLTLSVSVSTIALGEEFYKGKTLRLMPYTSPGSAHDVLARMAAPYLEKYIPGHPNVIVQNMPGAGGVIVANYVYRLAKPDGLTVGILSRGAPILWVASVPGVEYDASKFRWVLSPSMDITVCVAFADTGFQRVQDVVGSNKPLILSATGRGAGSFQVPATHNATLGTNIKIITGYRGGGEHQLAMERREVDGRCLSYFGTQLYPYLRNHLKSGALRFLVQLPSRHPALPEVPVANELASKLDDVALIKLVAAPLNPWVVPPGTPEDRLTVLREGFMKAFQNPRFRKLAERAQFELDPLPGDKAGEMLRRLLNVPEEAKQKLKKILGQ
ncbi:MAG: Bug family tripartite tricarboxylate transporter substrate binding protein [Dehalococcoidia bacterium]